MIVHEVTNDKRSNNMLLCKKKNSSVSSFFQMIQRKEIAAQFTKSINANTR